MKNIDLNKIYKVLDNFKNHRILVFGDLMIDEFIFSDVKRISPEAPVPIAEVKEKSYRLGGASNVAANIKSLDGEVMLSGVVGDDGFGRLFKQTALDMGIDVSCITEDNTRPTTVKTRIIAHNQQIARIDSEKKHIISNSLSEIIFDSIKNKCEKFDAVIVSDYAKGALNNELIKKITDFFRKNGKISAIDPKVRNIELLRGFDYIKPNVKEAEILSEMEIFDEKTLFEAGQKMFETLKPEAFILTRGPEGITAFDRAGHFTVPTVAKKVYDVTGAGDTTIAVFTMALCSGATLREAVIIANVAAGIVVGEVGTATVKVEDIKNHIGELINEQ
ncbi:MAG: D-glycero-beta-D-manno-heptose-7-phosphate kinase [Candidatus Muiribacteriota bacterium]